MKISVKKIIAREFLVLLSLVVLTGLSYCFILIRTQYIVSCIEENTSKIEFEKLRKDTLLSFKQLVKPYEFLTWEEHKELVGLNRSIGAPSASKFVPPEVLKSQKSGSIVPSADLPAFDPTRPYIRLSAGCEVVPDYVPIEKPFSAATSLQDYCLLRKNLISLHQILIINSRNYTGDSTFYQSNYHFDSFLTNINQDFLRNIYLGLSGESTDFYPVCNIPITFNSFCASIGVDTVHFTVIDNQGAQSLDQDITLCETDISQLEAELNTLNSSKFLHIDKFAVSIWVLLILAALAYGLRALYFMTRWSIKTLKDNSSKTPPSND